MLSSRSRNNNGRKCREKPVSPRVRHSTNRSVALSAWLHHKTLFSIYLPATRITGKNSTGCGYVHSVDTVGRELIVSRSWKTCYHPCRSFSGTTHPSDEVRDASRDAPLPDEITRRRGEFILGSYSNACFAFLHHRLDTKSRNPTQEERRWAEVVGSA